jgi:hypothetical protein
MIGFTELAAKPIAAAELAGFAKGLTHPCNSDIDYDIDSI